MSKKLGRQFKLYYSATLLAAATDAAVKAHNWTEAPTVADVNEDSEAEEIEYKTRENEGQTQYFAGPFAEQLTFNLAYDKADAFFMAIRAAYYARGEIALASVDAAVDTTGTIGCAANYVITNFPKALELGSVAEAEVTARPSSFIVRDYECP